MAHQASDPPRRGEGRRITGVLTLYTEGESFRECPLKEPWNCFAARGLECGSGATPAASAKINAVITKVGATQGFATFGIVMLGTRIDGIKAGHQDGYACQYHARSVLKVKEVPSRPPDTSRAIDFR
jgi:hypothetical protein